MAQVLQLRRGTTAQNNIFTGAAGEVTVDTDRESLRIHDGVTVGGKEIADLATAIPLLTDATTVGATDELIVQQAGVTKRATGAELAKGLNAINGTVNVRDFGAVGDGTTDDTAAFQAAAATGKMVFVPKPSVKYTFASPLAIDTPLWVDPSATYANLTDSGKLSFEAASGTTSSPLWRLPGRIFSGGAAEASDVWGATTAGSRDWLLDHHLASPGSWPVGTNATITSGSTSVTYTPTIYVPKVGSYIYAPGIAPGTTVSNVNTSTNTITLSANATSTASGVSLLGQQNADGIWAAHLGQIRCLSNNYSRSSIVGFFGSQTLGADLSAIGLSSFVVNNKASGTLNSWGGYFEAQRQNSTTGSALGIEVDVMSTSSSAETKSTPFQQSRTVALQVASGCGIAGDTPWGINRNTGAAIQIVNNPTSFRSGIVFGSTSLEGADGFSGTATAVALGPGHKIEWFNPSQDAVADIRATTGITASQKTSMLFTTVGARFDSSNGVSGYIFNSAGSTLVNWWTLQGNATGQPPTLSAAGTDTNVDLRLAAQGTGVLRFGTHSAVTTETLSGFIEIKDQAGNTRKLAVVS